MQHRPHVHQVWLVKEKQPQPKKTTENIKENEKKKTQKTTKPNLKKKKTQKTKKKKFIKNSKSHSKKKKNIKKKKIAVSKTEVNITKKGILRPTIHFPRYISTILKLKGRPLRRNTIVPGKGARAFARLYRSHFLTKLLEVVKEKKGKIWRQLTPYGFNSPYSYR